MFKKAMLVPFIALAACSGTSETICLWAVDNELSLLESAQENAQLNVDRGYATGYDVEPDSPFIKMGWNGRTRCAERRSDGTMRKFGCSYSVSSSQDAGIIPVDMDDERALLSDITRQFTKAQAEADARRAECRAV